MRVLGKDVSKPLKVDEPEIDTATVANPPDGQFAGADAVHTGAGAVSLPVYEKMMVTGVGRKTAMVEKSELAKKLDATKHGVLAAIGEGKASVATLGEFGPDLPSGVDFARLGGLSSRAAPTQVHLSSRVGGPFVVVLPPGFDPGRSYRARTVLSVPNELEALGHKLVGSKSTEYLAADEVLVLLDRGRIGKWDPVEVATSRLKPSAGLHIDGFTDAVVLDGAPGKWSRTIKQTRTEAPEAPAAAVEVAEKDDAHAEVRRRAVGRARADMLGQLASLPADAPGVKGMIDLIEAQIPAEPEQSGAALEKLEGTARRFGHLVDQTVARHSVPVEKKEAPAKARPKTKVGKADQKLLTALATAHPILAKPLERVVAERPELFAGKDEVTGETFAASLTAFVDGGYMDREHSNAEGVARFLTRVTEGDFQGHVRGYSHTQAVCRQIVSHHPGLILKLIQSALDDEPYETKGAYPNDGGRVIPPLAEFKRPFARSYGSYTMSDQIIGYERGLLFAIVDHLAPTRGEVHPDLVLGRSPCAAIAFQKLTGLKVRYNYAYGLSTGDDLKAALKAAGPKGISMGDVDIRLGAGREIKPHFPLFTDYDPDTDTVKMQPFGGNTYRIPVDGMILRRVAAYHFSDGALDAFLTPQHETLMGDEHPGLKKNKRPPLE